MKMKTQLAVVCISVIVLFVASCTKDKLAQPITDPNGTVNNCDPELVYFENDVLPIIASNCAYSGCHGGGSAEDDVELSSYTSIIATAKVKAGNPADSKLFKVINLADPSDVMPPPPNNRLTTDQINTIERWISQGAKDIKCESQVNCEIGTVTFSQTIQPIIANKCQGCHSGGAPQGSLSLTNYNEIKTSVNSGRFYGSINHDPGYVAMPYNLAKLPQCEIDQLADWIAAGAPNN